jgi:peptidyl-tRNA hydrolase
LSTGSCVVVPDCPPMNEHIDNKIQVQIDQLKRVGFGIGNTLTEEDIEKYVSDFLATKQNYENIAKSSRKLFLNLKDKFEKNVKSFINGTDAIT